MSLMDTAHSQYTFPWVSLLFCKQREGLDICDPLNYKPMSESMVHVHVYTHVYTLIYLIKYSVM